MIEKVNLRLSRNVKMQAVVLDEFKEAGSIGILCRVEFEDYIANLPSNFRDYFVQRGIASNRYLDNLWETIVEKKHIPLMVLVADESDKVDPSLKSIELNGTWKILDGLQRTHRMKLISQVVKYQIEYVDNDPNLMGDLPTIPQTVRKHRPWLIENDCPSSLFAKILSTKRDMSKDDFESVFKGVTLWLEVWFGLSRNEQIQKMLILNAGHKSVNIKHQIELLFSDYFSILEDSFPNGEIIRERDLSSISYSKSRTSGQFHFSHLVTAFQSLDAGKPISTNAEYAAEQSLSMPTGEDSKLEFNIELLTAFASFLWSLDRKLDDDANSIKWLGREVVLAGLFGAIGKHAMKKHASKVTVLEEFEQSIPNFVDWLRLDEFEEARNSLNLAKVNIGIVNKTAVQNATLQFLDRSDSPSPNWLGLFTGKSDYDV